MRWGTGAASPSSIFRTRRRSAPPCARSPGPIAIPRNGRPPGRPRTIEMTETLLRAEGLERYYGDRRAVDDVDVTLARGEVLGLLGPNGAGKSTVMRMLSGALPPSAGRIVIDGYDLLDNARAAKRSLGYLPELPPDYPEMAVADYLAYCAALRGVPRRMVRPAVHSALERCALTDV